jgi:hypothetical protein
MVEQGGVEAIVMNASGCGVTVKEYGHLLQRRPAVRRQGRAHQRLTRDLSASCCPTWWTRCKPAHASAQGAAGAGGLSTRPARCSTARSCAAASKSTWARWASGARERQ